jgi:hypothetical protein
MPALLARSVLLAPAPVARAAATAVREPEQRWMLVQPRDVRASYVRDVLDRGDHEGRQEAWMLRQPAEVRESFVRHVLMRLSPPPLQEIWMLRQPDEVRESFVRDVLEPRDAAATSSPAVAAGARPDLPADAR